MWLLGIIGLAGFVFWQSNKRRAKRFVRAVHFLEMLDDGLGVDQANGRVALLFSKQSSDERDNAALVYAIDKANRWTEGNQLPWIHEAREKGFAIDSENSRFDMADLSGVVERHNGQQKNPKHFSEGAYIDKVNSRFPHTGSNSEYTTHPQRMSFLPSKESLSDYFGKVASVGWWWGVRGGVAGLVLGVLVPMLGPLGSLEPWAVPLVFAYLGALTALAWAIGYHSIRWISGTASKPGRKNS